MMKHRFVLDLLREEDLQLMWRSGSRPEAIKVMEVGVPTHYRVDLTAGLFYEDGGICGGIMDVFIEPV